MYIEEKIFGYPNAKSEFELCCVLALWYIPEMGMNLFKRKKSRGHSSKAKSHYSGELCRQIYSKLNNTNLETMLITIF